MKRFFRLSIRKKIYWYLGTISIAIVSVFLFFYLSFASLFSGESGLTAVTLSLLMLCLGLMILFSSFLSKAIFKPAQKVQKNVSDLAGVQENAKTNPKDLFEKLYDDVLHIEKSIDEANQVIERLKNRDFNFDFTYLNAESGLGKALTEMGSHLKNISREEAERTWSINGISKFNNFLRDNQNQKIEELSNQFLIEMVRYLRANQGAVYVIRQEEEKEYVELIASYAYERKRHLHKKLDKESGLIGRCILEKDVVYIDNLPDDFLQISSGLGTANPSNLILAPVMVNEEVFGVFELATFNKLAPHEIRFIETICKNFASVISSILTNTRTKDLYQNAQKVTQELLAKEETLQKNTAALKEVQETLNEKIIKLEKSLNKTQSLVDIIHDNHIYLELDTFGKIIQSNEVYAHKMGFNMENISGISEKNFVPKGAIRNYESMLIRVQSGEAVSGTFNRIGKEESHIGMVGTYMILQEDHGNRKIVFMGNFTDPNGAQEETNYIPESNDVIDRESTIPKVNTPVTPLLTDLKNITPEESIQWLEERSAPYLRISSIQGDYIIHDISNAAKKLLGENSGDLIDKSLFLILHFDTIEAYESLSIQLEQPELSASSILLRSESGELNHYDVTLVPYTYQDGGESFWGTLVVF